MFLLGYYQADFAPVFQNGNSSLFICQWVSHIEKDICQMAQTRPTDDVCSVTLFQHLMSVQQSQVKSRSHTVFVVYWSGGSVCRL